MKDELITDVMQQMLPYLDNAQLKQLRQVMEMRPFPLGTRSCWPQLGHLK